MSERTIHLHRVLRCPPQRLYRAFTEAGAMAKWLPPHGFTCQVHHLEARVGGSFRMSFHNFGSGPDLAVAGPLARAAAGPLGCRAPVAVSPAVPGERDVVAGQVKAHAVVNAIAVIVAALHVQPAVVVPVNQRRP